MNVNAIREIKKAAVQARKQSRSHLRMVRWHTRKGGDRSQAAQYAVWAERAESYAEGLLRSLQILDEAP